MLTIGVDLDGVLRNLHDALVEVYQCVYPSHEVKPITAWGLGEFFPIGNTIFEFLWETHPWAIARRAKPYPEAQYFLEALLDFGRLSLVTYQPTDAVRQATLQWLREHPKLFRPMTDLILLGANGLKKGCLGLDILIDDGTHNLRSCLSTPTLPICISRPWNQDWPGLRAASLHDCLALVRRLDLIREVEGNKA